MKIIWPRLEESKSIQIPSGRGKPREETALTATQFCGALVVILRETQEINVRDGWRPKARSPLSLGILELLNLRLAFFPNCGVCIYIN